MWSIFIIILLVFSLGSPILGRVTATARGANYCGPVTVHSPRRDGPPSRAVLSAILRDEYLTPAVRTKEGDKAGSNQPPARDPVQFKLELTPKYWSPYLENIGCVWCVTSQKSILSLTFSLTWNIVTFRHLDKNEDVLVRQLLITTRMLRSAPSKGQTVIGQFLYPKGCDWSTLERLTGNCQISANGNRVFDFA